MTNKDSKQTPEITLDKIISARQIMGEALESADNVKSPVDKLTALKLGYSMAIEYAPDPTKRKHNLKFVKTDDYMTKLGSLRTATAYRLSLYEGKKLNEQQKLKYRKLKMRDDSLHKKQVALAKYQEYVLKNSRTFFDELLALTKDNEIAKLTSEDFLDYIKPYRIYLQNKFIELRPDMTSRR